MCCRRECHGCGCGEREDLQGDRAAGEDLGPLLLERQHGRLRVQSQLGFRCRSAPTLLGQSGRVCPWTTVSHSASCHWVFSPLASITTLPHQPLAPRACMSTLLLGATGCPGRGPLLSFSGVGRLLASAPQLEQSTTAETPWISSWCSGSCPLSEAPAARAPLLPTHVLPWAPSALPGSSGLRPACRDRAIQVPASHPSGSGAALRLSLSRFPATRAFSHLILGLCAWPLSPSDQLQFPEDRAISREVCSGCPYSSCLLHAWGSPTLG